MQLGHFIKYMFSELPNAGFYFKDFRVILLRRFFFIKCTSYTLPSRNLFWIKLGSTNKNIHLRDFKDVFLKYGF